MVRKAKEKRLYRRLLVGDVTETVERLHRESKNAPAALGAGTRRPRGWDVPAEPEEEGGAAVAVATAATTTVPGEDEGPAFPAPAVRAPASETAVGEGGATTKSALEGIVATQPGSGRGSDGSCIASASASSAGARGGELVISCDVFVYIGSLRACFKAVHELVTGGRSLIAEPQETGAIFAFSAEAPPATNTTERKEGGAGGANSSGTRPGYELQGTGRWVVCFRRRCRGNRRPPQFCKCPLESFHQKKHPLFVRGARIRREISTARHRIDLFVEVMYRTPSPRHGQLGSFFLRSAAARVSVLTGSIAENGRFLFSENLDNNVLERRRYPQQGLGSFSFRLGKQSVLARTQASTTRAKFAPPTEITLPR